MTVYVERKNGAVCGVYSNPQPSAAEAIDDQHADVVAYRSSIESPKAGEQGKQSAFKIMAQQAVADLTAYRGSILRTTLQRDAFENRLCEILTAALNRMAQMD